MSRHEKRVARYNRQFGEHAETIRGLPCSVCKKPPPSDPAHVRSRGAGGGSDDLIPLCRIHHRLQHDKGWSALSALGLDVERVLADCRALRSAR